MDFRRSFPRSARPPCPTQADDAPRPRSASRSVDTAADRATHSDVSGESGGPGPRRQQAGEMAGRPIWRYAWRCCQSNCNLSPHLMTDVDAALERQVLDIAQRERVAEVKHLHQLDDLRRAVEPAEGVFGLRSARDRQMATRHPLPAGAFGLTVPADFIARRWASSTAC